MLSTWRSVEVIARRQLQKFTHPNPPAYDYEDVPLDEVSEPLLLSSSSEEPLSNTSSPFSPSSSPKRTNSSKWRSRPRQMACLIIAAAVILFSPKIITFLHLYSDPGFDEAFLPSRIPKPHDVEPAVPPIPSAKGVELGLIELQQELSGRLRRIGMPTSGPQIYCTSLQSTASQSRYAHLQESHKTHDRTLIALNLFESGEVLPSIGRALLEFAYFLGRSSIHVSIFENGSRKDNTTMGLAHLAAVLTAAEVPHTIMSDPTPTHWTGIDRIEQLAIYRNVVMEPLYATAGRSPSQSSSARAFTNVLFINDVFFCAVDALELLHVRKAQNAHATCGLDYRWRTNFLTGILGSGPKARNYI